MNYTKSILPILWEFLNSRSRKRNFSISMNIYEMDNELVISIINRNRIKRFKNTDVTCLKKHISTYLKV